MKQKIIFDPISGNLTSSLTGTGGGGVTDHSNLTGVYGGISSNTYHLAKFNTKAECKAAAPTIDGTMAYVLETQMLYTYCENCAYPADDDLILITGNAGDTRWTALQHISRTQGDTGWINKDNATLTALSSTSIRVSISSTASISIKGVRIPVPNGNYDLTITGSAGVKFIGFDDDTLVLKQQDTLWDFGTQCPVALVYWTGTAIAAAPQTEYHGIRDTVWHSSEHRFVGLKYVSGLTFTGSVQPDNNTNPGTDTVQYLWSTDGIVQDEDVQSTPGINQWLQTLGSGLTNTTAAIFNHFYYNGTALTPLAAMSDRTPFIHAGGNTLPQWNNAGTLTAATNGQFVVYHYFVTPMVGGWSVFARPHNAVFTSLATALNARPSQLTWSNYAEIKHIYTAVFRCNTGWTTVTHRCKLVSLQDFRTVASGPVAATSATDHNALSNRGSTLSHPILASYATIEGAVPFHSVANLGLVEDSEFVFDEVNKTLKSRKYVAGGGTPEGLLRVTANSANGGAVAMLFDYFDTSSSGAAISFRKSNSTSIDGLAATENLNVLGQLVFSGVVSGGTRSPLSASIACIQQSSAGAAYVSSDLVLSTCPILGTNTERMRIRAGGYVGIAVNNPQSVLHVAQTGAGNTLRVDSYTTGTTTSPTIALVKSHTTAIGTNTATINTEGLGRLSFNGVNSSTNITEASYVEAQQVGAAGATYNASDIAFYAGTSSAAPTEQMRILSTGGVRIKGTTDAAPAAGYIGETKTTTITDTTATNTDTAVTLSNGIVLGAGTWEIYYSCMAYFATGSSTNDRGQVRLWIYEQNVGIATDIGSTTSSIGTRTVSATGNDVQVTLSKSIVVTITSGTKDYRLGCKRIDGQGTGSATIYGGILGSFYAVRRA